ncbi:uncharacterized protein EI90DRAFT_3117109 [Cantharellus anzutake]|uniref:uncharacterized protein n=1 Tax=Cantharellus anzutake TaxID=1750568 RepID=UPI001902C2DD|nr:uncharacterized protein EI90DRAFT_3117109 [Cantharellus anzutake]KAF8340598.1 hypothetical protein EI90DRAFT_3117109 [Cantharellus anzutake]
MFETNYRVFFAKSVARLLTPPLFIAYFISRFFLESLNALLVPFFYLVVSLIWVVLVIQFKELSQHLDARRRGAVLVPKTGLTIEGAELFDELNADTVNLRFLWRDIILTREPQIIQSVLSTHFSDFEKGPLLKIRALTRPFLVGHLYDLLKLDPFLNGAPPARERVRDHHLFDKYSNIIISLIQQRSLQNESLDVQDLFGRLTLDAAGEFLFGTTDLQTLSLPLPPPAKRSKLGPKGTRPDDTVAVGTYSGFVCAFEEVQVSIVHRFRYGPLWPIVEWFKDATQEHNEAIDAWIAPLIKKALEDKKYELARS